MTDIAPSEDKSYVFPNLSYLLSKILHNLVFPVIFVNCCVRWQAVRQISQWQLFDFLLLVVMILFCHSYFALAFYSRISHRREQAIKPARSYDNPLTCNSGINCLIGGI